MDEQVIWIGPGATSRGPWTWVGVRILGVGIPQPYKGRMAVIYANDERIEWLPYSMNSWIERALVNASFDMEFTYLIPPGEHVQVGLIEVRR